MRNLGLGKKMHVVTPLKEEMAVELGADMFGEIFIFSVATLTIAAEYFRQKRNEIKHEVSQEHRIEEMQQSIRDLDLKVEEQDAKIRELTRLFLQTHPAPDTMKDSKSGVVIKVVK